ncbi:MAG: hypothetical protein J0L97_11075, partial [Alphaproteobacteria bacterium]|nr:hypothetical protein [Alphaproteobacteria bacterium]
APRWVEGGAFTDAFVRVATRIEAEARAAAPSDARRALVITELDHAAPTLVETDVAALPPAHQAFVGHMMRVAELVDRLYARQTGMEAMSTRLDASDAASASLFRRNWGPACRGSTTEREAACSAIDGAPRQPVDVYPASIQGEDDSFCASLEARPDAQALLGHFSVVRPVEGGDGLVAVPYHEAYADLMQPIAAELRAAADAMTDPNETALVAYLRAAAQGFETNDWTPADEAWSRMNARNSQWYVRVGPDETYWEPCSIHAGFHLTFARINQGSLVWQDRLTPYWRPLAGGCHLNREMPGLIENGHLFLAQPPLYRLTQGTQTIYARDDKHKEELVEKLSKGRGKIEVGRFKGLGEMTPSQLKETTMDPAKRILLRVAIAEEDKERTETRVEHLMGRKPELRFQFIQEQAAQRGGDLAEMLDV